MSYVKYNKPRKNSPGWWRLQCDFCFDEFPEAHPHIWNNRTGDRAIHICSQCMGKHAEIFIEHNKHGIASFCLSEMERKYLKRIRRKTYLPKHIREQILKKYQHRCNVCGSQSDLQIDHIKPVAKGGKDIAKNLQILRKTCNLKKGVRYD